MISRSEVKRIEQLNAQEPLEDDIFVKEPICILFRTGIPRPTECQLSSILDLLPQRQVGSFLLISYLDECQGRGKKAVMYPQLCGGPGTYSQLLILRDYMSRLASDLDVSEDYVYPADYFDLMGGVGFGGLAAIMLGHLKMNIDEAIDALVTVATVVFTEEPQAEVNPEANTRNLEEVVEGMLQNRGVPVNAKMYERERPQTRCKVVLYAATSANLNHPQPFRTYLARGSSLNPTIVEAVCATMAIDSLFSPIKIGPRLRQQSFIGGALGANNPTRELLKEAGAIFGPSRRVAQVLSIGCGLPRVASMGPPADEGNGQHLLEEIATDCEMVAQELSTRLYAIDAYLRLNVDRGMELLGLTDWYDLGPIESHTAAYISTATVTGALDTSLRHLKQKIGTLTLGQINQSSSIKIVAKKAPSVSPHFVLRNKAWEKLVWHLVMSPCSRQRILVITGMGGCGKTQLVSYFLQEYPSLFKHAVYVDASALSSIQADLQTWIRALGDGHEREVWEDAVRILTDAPGNERWGLILDNADDPMLNIVPFLPKSSNLTIVITSRNRNLGNLSTTYHMELGEMEPEEALATMLHAARRQLPLSAEEQKCMNTLLNELGCLAVALVQAGTYCRELSYSFKQYLALFYSHRAELMKTAEPSSLDNYQRGAYTTLDLSYNALPHAARKFLHFISYFHHTDIPLSALATAAKRNFEEPPCYLPRAEDHASVIVELKRLLCVDNTWGEMQVQEILRTLQSFSLLSITSIDDSVLLQLHPLIQAWSRDMDHSASHHRAMALQVLTACYRGDAFRLRPQLLPHILNIKNQIKGQDIHVNDLMASGKVLYDRGHYRAAGELFETALELMEKTSGNNEEIISKISEWLASLYQDEGRWNDAEMLGVNVLEQRRRILGVEHPDTITAVANLAVVYGVQGRWAEAERLGLEVLQQRRKVLGMEHPDTIMAIANLAGTYHAQGRWIEAEKLLVEALEKRRRIMGMEHPDTITAIANLAVVYRVQGRWAAAEKLGLEVLQRGRNVLGMEHPDTIMAAANLAVTYASQGRWSEAEKLEAEVLEQRKRIMGMIHPKTITAAANLASTYHSQGRWNEAEEVEVEVLEQRRISLGMEHPDTIRAVANLAMTYQALGRWNEAEKLGLEVLQQRRRILGMKHPATILATANLAATYCAQSRWSEAEELEEEVLEQRGRIMGLEHPDTIRAAGNLASTYHAQGRWSDAEKLGMEVLQKRMRVLGAEHPDTVIAVANLAGTYAKQDRWEELVALISPAVHLSLKVLGQQHPQTQAHISSLAFAYKKLGKEKEAQEMCCLSTDIVAQDI